MNLKRLFFLNLYNPQNPFSMNNDEYIEIQIVRPECDQSATKVRPKIYIYECDQKYIYECDQNYCNDCKQYNYIF